MRIEIRTPKQLKRFLKEMDQRYSSLIEVRDGIYQEIKKLKEQREILSWDEIAEAIAYPKASPDPEKVGGGSFGSDHIFFQMEKIQEVFRSQMEDLLEELEDVEAEISKIRCLRRYIYCLPVDDRKLVETYLMTDDTSRKAAAELGMSRSKLFYDSDRIIDRLLFQMKER